jgi:signal transduction histidine kinase/ActR/RegA family two-component response regulator
MATSSNPGELSPVRGIRRRILVPLVLALVLLLAGFVVMSIGEVLSRRNAEVVRVSNLLDRVVHSQLARSVETLSSLSDLIMRDRALEAVFRAGDREALYERSRPIFESIGRKDQVTHFYYHRLDGTVLLRVHHPEEHDDRITRFTLEEARRTGKPAAGNEQGPFGNCTLRVVTPWYSSGAVIGYLELGIEFEDLMLFAHELLDAKVIVAVEKSLLDRGKWESTQQRAQRKVSWDEFPSVVVLSRTGEIPDSVIAYLKQSGAPKTKQFFQVDWRERVYQTVALPFTDVRGRELGQILVLLDITALTRRALSASVWAVSAGAALGGVLLTFFFVLIGRVERDIAERASKLAEAERGLALEQAERQRSEHERDLQKERIAALEARSRMAKELEAAKDAAETANRAKTIFLANMSHELRSPLNSIVGFARSMARDHELTSGAHNDLRVILQNSEHLRTLINQVLDWSKIEARRFTLTEAAFDIHGLLDELEDMFRVMAGEKGLRLVVARKPSVPGRGVTDPVRLRQVLVNLVSNAIKFTNRGSVTLHAEALPVAGAADAAYHLRFTVEDTGPGIESEELAGLFGPFVQARAGRQAKEGTGLGLAISKSLVELMGGRLEIESRVGIGTTIRFHVPARKAPVSELAGASERPQATPAHVVDKALAAPKKICRILVVDDRWAARHLLVRLLSPLGFELREARNGREAIDIWKTWSPDVICLDERMPGMDGREAARRIKAAPKGRRTAIIALTASSFEEDIEDLRAAGCDEVLSKPYGENELLALLHKHLGSHGTEPMSDQP